MSPETTESERRSSRRSEFRLPFQWQILSGDESLDEQVRRWALEPDLEQQRRQVQLAAEFEQAAGAVRDVTVTAALRALHARVELLESQAPNRSSAPSRQRVELSADGLGFWSDRALDTGSRLGVHVILPSGYQLIGEATVSRCNMESGGSNESRTYRIGVKFEKLDPAASRRLTRLVIS